MDHTGLNSEQVTALRSLEILHYTPVCDLVKTGVYADPLETKNHKLKRFSRFLFLPHLQIFVPTSVFYGKFFQTLIFIMKLIELTSDTTPC